jgi:putative ABC transport system substrate-binding protein
MRALKTLLAGLCCLLCATAVLAAPPPAQYKITMLVFRGCEAACQGFVDYIKARKIPAAIEILDAATDRQRMLTHIARVRRNKPDLVVTWGTTVSLEALGTYDGVDPAKHIVDVPAVFMIVSNPVGVRLVPDYQSSGRNVTGTRYVVSEEVQLKVARSYLPFERLAIIYNPQEENSLQSLANLRQQAGSLGFTLIERPVGLAGGKPDPESLPGLVAEVARAGAQLLYQPPDTFLLLHRAALTGAAVAVDLPVFAAAEVPVRDGQALMGVVNRYYTVGQLSGAQAERILLHKVPPSAIPIEAPRNFSFLVNMPVARALKRYPPMQVLKIADVIE